MSTVGGSNETSPGRAPSHSSLQTRPRCGVARSFLLVCWFLPCVESALSVCLCVCRHDHKPSALPNAGVPAGSCALAVLTAHRRCPHGFQRPHAQRAAVCAVGAQLLPEVARLHYTNTCVLFAVLSHPELFSESGDTPSIEAAVAASMNDVSIPARQLLKQVGVMLASLTQCLVPRKIVPFKISPSF